MKNIRDMRHILAFVVILTTILAMPSSLSANQPGFCSDTASAQFDACMNEVRDDFFTAKAICINVSDKEEREECFVEAEAVRTEGTQLCGEQHNARRDICDALGENRYDPNFDPANFDDDFTNLTNPNPYFPLGIGNRWEYGGAETISIEVLNKTKNIEGVTCIVVNDLVTEDGKPIEDTDDWFAQAKDRNVWYCGEETKSFETFKGDHPREPELVSIDGSFKAGRDGDKPGFIFLADPSVGDVYRQEFSLGNAEDVVRVLSTTYGFGNDPQLDKFVPKKLAKLLCANDCVVTRDFTPIDPGKFERKYYARGVGLFLEVDPDAGEVVQLVDCNFDPRCADLPRL